MGCEVGKQKQTEYRGKSYDGRLSKKDKPEIAQLPTDDQKLQPKSESKLESTSLSNLKKKKVSKDTANEGSGVRKKPSRKNSQDNKPEPPRQPPRQQRSSNVRMPSPNLHQSTPRASKVYNGSTVREQPPLARPTKSRVELGQLKSASPISQSILLSTRQQKSSLRENEDPYKVSVVEAKLESNGNEKEKDPTIVVRPAYPLGVMGPEVKEMETSFGNHGSPDHREFNSFGPNTRPERGSNAITEEFKPAGLRSPDKHSPTQNITSSFSSSKGGLPMNSLKQDDLPGLQPIPGESSSIQTDKDKGNLPMFGFKQNFLKRQPQQSKIPTVQGNNSSSNLFKPSPCWQPAQNPEVGKNSFSSSKGGLPMNSQQQDDDIPGLQPKPGKSSQFKTDKNSFGLFGMKSPSKQAQKPQYPVSSTAPQMSTSPSNLQEKNKKYFDPIEPINVYVNGQQPQSLLANNFKKDLMSESTMRAALSSLSFEDERSTPSMHRFDYERRFQF